MREEESGQSAGSPRPEALDLAVLAFAVLFVGSSVGWFLPRTALRDARLGFGARLGLFASEVVAVALLGAIAFGLSAGLEVLQRRVGGARPRRILGALVLGTVWAFLFAYGVSWALFRSMGTFLDPGSIELVRVDFVILLKHLIELNPLHLVIVPSGAALAVAALASLAKRHAALPLPQRKRLRVAAAAVLLLAILSASWGQFAAMASTQIVQDPARGTVLSFERAYRQALATSVGPVSHFAASSLARPALEVETPRAEEQIASRILSVGPFDVETRPLISPSDYASLAGATAGKKRLNVVVLLVESMRPDILPAAGTSAGVMPNVERLALTSRRFTNAYAQSTHSDYADLCPLSSQYPLRSTEHHYYPENPTYPRVLVYDLLKALGYRTAIVSSQNERWGNMYYYLDTGGIDHFFHADTYHTTIVDEEDEVFSRWAKEFGHSGKVDDRHTVDEAIRWIGGSRQPFFLYLNLQNSHFPYRTPEGFPRRFSPDTIDFAYTFGNFPRDKVAVVKNRYKNALSYMDAQIGRLVDFLAGTGRFDDTILVVTGDNGEAFYEHDFAGHAGPLYDEALRVALLIRAPGLSAGDDSRLTEHVDVPPTLLALLGLPPHPGFQGTDLVRTAPDPNRSAYVVAQTLIHQLGLIRNGYKLIADFDYRRYLLYDLVRDPGESRDLSKIETDRVVRMGARLRAFQKAQLGYYEDVTQHRKVYPPTLSERDPAPRRAPAGHAADAPTPGSSSGHE